MILIQARTFENDTVPAREVFKELDKKYGKTGAIIRGWRIRDGLTQKELALKIDVHQVHISQIEHGKRKVGKVLARRFANLFRTDYRLFL